EREIVTYCSSAPTSRLPSGQRWVSSFSERTQSSKRLRGSRTFVLPSETKRVERWTGCVCRREPGEHPRPDADRRNSTRAQGTENHEDHQSGPTEADPGMCDAAA